MADPGNETCQHAVEGIYHGRTELGIGQHDKIKSRLNEELHSEYGDHLRKEESDRVRKTEEDGEPQTVYGYESSTGSVADIGYESAKSIVNKRKQLNDDRRSEYEAHLASKPGRTFHQDGSGDANGVPTEDAQDGSATMVSSYGSSESFERDELDEREQKQHDYAESLREQIAEKKTITDRIQKRHDFDDLRNEWGQGSGQNYHYDSPSVKGFSGSSRSSEQDELDDRSRKHQDYADALTEQIAEKKKITDGIKSKQDFEDERSDAHMSTMGSHFFNTESGSMKGFSGSSQSSDEHDERRQKQLDYAEALREQIAEKKNITDRIKNIQAFVDESNDRTEESRKPVPHYFNSESPKKTGYPASSEMYGQEEVDERRQKQLDYADALREQIAAKKTITDRIKKKENDEDERNEWAHGSSHGYQHPGS